MDIANGVTVSATDDSKSYIFMCFICNYSNILNIL